LKRDSEVHSSPSAADQIDTEPCSPSDVVVSSPVPSSITNILTPQYYTTNNNSEMVQHDLDFQKRIENGKYAGHFTEFEIINAGDSLVIGVNDIVGDKFVIKIIAINKLKNEAFREVEILKKLLESKHKQYFVQYISDWVENNYYEEKDDNFFKEKKIIQAKNNFKDKERPFLLHIQMEYCSTTLKLYIEQIKIELNINESERLTPICYYIVSELCTELIECVNSLHEENPPIIHRDLKPENILITDGSNGRFVKVADFGLSTMHNFDKSHTKDVGTTKYMAPEVLQGRNYDTKADIHSLGVIMENFFNIDANE
jgi:serine/threonine protein kinase